MQRLARGPWIYYYSLLTAVKAVFSSAQRTYGLGKMRSSPTRGSGDYLVLLFYFFDSYILRIFYIYI